MPVPSDTLTNITDRPNYYAGQYLLEDDFELEQQYHLDRLRRHHRLLHIAGIMHGLEVSWADSPTNTKLQVTAGTAIDADGRQIVLPQIKGDVAIPASIAATGSLLFIRYESSEFSTQGTTASQPAASSTPMEGKNRIKEEPVFEWGTTVPTGAIALARVSTAKALDFSDRIYSGIRLPSPRNTLGGGLTLRYKDNGTAPAAKEPELAEFTGNLSITGTLAITGSSTLTGDVSIGNNLTVSKALNFGSTDRQMINLWRETCGIGVQNNTQYFRTYQNFAWYKGGSHAPNALEAGPNGTVQMVIKDGNVGIGTRTPSEKLEVNGNIKATNATLGGTLAVTGATTLTGNATLGGTLSVAGALNFGSTARQMINLYDLNYGIGVQNNTQYFRTYQNFAWYKGGSHADGELTAGTNGTVQMVIKDGNVGIGTTTPAAKLDVTGTLELRGGGWSGTGGNQIVLGNPTDTNRCRHVIKTRHSTGLGGGNAIDFYLWDPALDKDSNQIGTSLAMILETGGNKGNLTVMGGITEQLPIINVGNNPPEWNRDTSEVYKYFRNSLKGKPVGTMVKAITQGKWDGHYWIGWIGTDTNKTIYILPIVTSATAGSAS